MIRALSLAAFVATGVAIATPAVSATCMVRVPASLSSDSERSGPMVPGPCKQGQKGSKLRQARPVDPMKEIRNRVIAGAEVSYKELETLADSGDDLAQFYLAKRIEADNDPETLGTAARYYMLALENGRSSALRPLIRVLNGGAVLSSFEDRASAQLQLERLAADGDAVARDALIAMYRKGKPLGLDPARADTLLVTSAEAGDSKAALDLAFELLSGTPDADEIDKARGYLRIAATSETLNIRTMAENILRTLDPQLTASTETLQ
ncbi:hypothetical protein PRN20_11005 [Devosia sp. ZB163]|uniref:hypothetical protein n=1 Tax=Devosia sp. ZB163 TaxID=3025938 RepID=UPI00235FEF45|nr:hypothetical protein [Devosia sp. ZB163]MDC9824266.1 hypothetical protein [Devosia sp. ZB163]